MERLQKVMAHAGIAENKITLKKGEFFVLGDNRNNSEDSRSANIGIINKKNKNRQLKLTWSEYAHYENPGFSMGLGMIVWPVLLLIAICYYTFKYPTDCIKKHNGIK